MNILVTGGAGFIGGSFIRYYLQNSPHGDTTSRIINYDVLGIGSNIESLKDVEENERYVFVEGDITDRAKVTDILQRYDITHIINFAAETHVDRSIEDSTPFVHANVIGTQVLLECARDHDKLERFYQISTDEVYGALSFEDENIFTEDTPLAPKNPYSASKAAADLLVLSYVNTYNFPALISRCSNNFGPYQYPEKFIPYASKLLMDGKKIQVYGDGKHIRDWIFVDDHCEAVALLLHKGRLGEVYNIGGSYELPNIEVAEKIAAFFEKDDAIEFVEDRKGHDRRYAMAHEKITKEFGWEPRTSFDEALNITLNHFKETLS